MLTTLTSAIAARILAAARAPWADLHAWRKAAPEPAEPEPEVEPAPWAPEVAHEWDGDSRRGTAVDAIVVHESVTYDLPSTIRVLKGRGYAVHYALPPDGRVVELAPPDRSVFHAGMLNRRSIGIEVISPYYPARPGHARPPWERTIRAPWAHEREYTLPLPAQLDALHRLVGWLLRTQPAIPERWVGLKDGKLALGLVSGAESAPGIHAHHYTAHADGAFPVLYLYLRRVVGLEHMDAYDRAVALATGAGRWVPVPELTEAP